MEHVYDSDSDEQIENQVENDVLGEVTKSKLVATVETLSRYEQIRLDIIQERNDKLNLEFLRTSMKLRKI